MFWRSSQDYVADKSPFDSAGGVFVWDASVGEADSLAGNDRKAGADSLAGNNGKKGKSKSSRFFGLPNEESLLGVSAIVERMEQLCRLWRQPSTVL